MMDILKFDIPALQLAVNIALSAALSFVSARVYVRCGTSLSNRGEFSGNFYILAMVTTLVISIVKSSLALSLGLVGALSIVRFRTAIKEPEELAFLFISIGIGLGIGANQPLLTGAAVAVICLIVIARTIVAGWFSGGKSFGYNMTVLAPNPDGLDVAQLTALIGEHTGKCELKRVQSSKESLDASYRVELGSADALSRITDAITTKNPQAEVTFLDVDNTRY